MGANLFLTPVERARFAAAKVGIGGAGGLGSNCAMHLVRAGLSRLVFADFDVVSESNLNRQFFFRDQVGRLKVDALAENLRRIDPGADLEAKAVRVEPGNFAETFSGCDVLVEAFDSAGAKRMFVAEALKLGKPVVTASGLAGWGRGSAMSVRRLGGRVVAVGDGESEAGRGGLYPVSPRTGIAAAMEANAVCAVILGLEP